MLDRLAAEALWAGSGMFEARPAAYRPSFWSNALITALMLLGPAIEDSAGGRGVFEASAVRTILFVGVALYAWATVKVSPTARSARISLLAG